jgi:DNA-binding CsgD family transcriptional regulator
MPITLQNNLTSKKHAIRQEGRKKMKRKKIDSRSMENGNFDKAYEQVKVICRKCEYIKDSPYHLENLQQASLSLLVSGILSADSTLSTLDYVKLLKKAIRDSNSNFQKSWVKLDNLKVKLMDCQGNIEYGLTEQHILELLADIKAILTDREYEIFCLYNIDGYTLSEQSNELGEKLNMTRKQVRYALTKINQKLFPDKSKKNETKYKGIASKYFVDSRYATYNSQSKKRHLRYEDYTEGNSDGYKVDPLDYEPMINEPVSNYKETWLSNDFEINAYHKEIKVKNSENITSDFDSLHSQTFVRNVYDNSQTEITCKVTENKTLASRLRKKIIKTEKIDYDLWSQQLYSDYGIDYRVK